MDARQGQRLASRRLSSGQVGVCCRTLEKVLVVAGKKPVEERLVAALGRTSAYLERLLVEEGGRSVVLRLDQVSHVEAARNYVTLYAPPARHLVRGTLSALEAKLDPKAWVRVIAGVPAAVRSGFRVPASYRRKETRSRTAANPSPWKIDPSASQFSS